MKKETEHVLLINDIAGYGKISLGVMIPIMSHMGFNIYNLPTAVVSNTLDYGLFDILDTTDYMRNTLKVWKELGFSFVQIDGHDFAQILDAFKKARECKGKPTMIIANTVKGKGVSFMENNPGWHGKAPNDEETKQAVAELGGEM